MIEPDYNTKVRLQKRYAYNFIDNVLFHNPVWDIGLKHIHDKKKLKNDYRTQLKLTSNYTFNCICPCSIMFQKWHQMLKVNENESFEPCQTSVFDTPIDFVKHVFRNQQNFYHQLIVRCVQLNYAQTICNLKVQNEYQDNNLQNMNFPIPKQSIKLPTAIRTFG